MRGTCTMAISALLLAFACGGNPLGSSASTQTGTTSTGGNFATGGIRSSGDGLGGTQTGMAGSGGMTSTGGVAATGGSSVVPCTAPAKISANNCGMVSTASGSLGIDWNYYYMGYPFQGYAYVFISPTPNSLDTLICRNIVLASSNPGYGALCGAGTVPPDCTGNTVAGIGFNLNQPQWGYGTYDNGYTQPTNPISFPITADRVTVTFINTANSDLRVQIAQHSDSGPTYYCSDIAGMQSPVEVATSHFTKTCWNSASPGAVWDGTGAESIALIIPSQESKPTPFYACIQNVEFHGQ